MNGGQALDVVRVFLVELYAVALQMECYLVSVIADHFHEHADVVGDRVRRGSLVCEPAQPLDVEDDTTTPSGIALKNKL